MLTIGNYKVTWEYSCGNEEVPNVTICSLYDGEELIGTGRAFQHHSDHFEKDKGRKISMTRVLGMHCVGNKELRKKFWEAYRLMTPIPRW